MPILEAAVRKTRFRRRFDDLLLPCVRSLLIVVLTIAFAGPLLESSCSHLSPASVPVVQAVHRPRVLIVDGSASAAGSDRSCADFTVLALEDWEPRRRDATQWYDDISADGSADAFPVNSNRLPGDLERFDVLVLCDLAFPNPRESEILHRFSASGRGLVIFFGERTDIETWNSGFFQGPVLGGLRTGNQIADAAEPLNPLQYRHPVVAPFRDHPHAGLTALPVDRYFPLSNPKTTTGTRHSERLEPILTFANGDPLIASQTGDLGRILLWTTAPQPSMSRIAVRPAFVPLIRETVLFAAQRIVPPGESLIRTTISTTTSPSPETGLRTTALALRPWLLLAASLVFAAETLLRYCASRIHESPVA